MATLLGDYAADHSRFMMPTSLPYQHSHPHESRYRPSPSTGSPPRSTHSPRQAHSAPTPASSSSTDSLNDLQRQERKLKQGAEEHKQPIGDAASRFPTPPDSSSPSVTNFAEARPQDGDSPPRMASSGSAHADSGPPSASTIGTVVPVSGSHPPTQTIPSPGSDGGSTWTQPSAQAAAIDTAIASDAPRTQKTVHVTDLAHIQKLAHLDLVAGNGQGILNDPPLQDMKFEISGMPIGDIIEMVAALLTKITTTNDLQHDALNRNATHQRQAQAQSDGSETHSSPYSTSVLAFHGKNVPAITILSYLSRIHKYCPTTYEVFLSLLVYFDRMTERVNELVMKDEESRRRDQPEGTQPAADSDLPMGDASSDSDELAEDLADSDDEEELPRDKSAAEGDQTQSTDTAVSSATYFVVDSFNIHRLIIAGVTCASKFFSDVFYTNSRYAKVGGLPLAELNHLELQFLLLNDFRLAVPVEDLEAYATMLVEFYAREVVAQRSKPVAGPA